MWFNFHTHSSYCDGKTSVEDIIAKAKLLRMRCLGISSHAPLPFDCLWCMKPAKFADYVERIRMLKDVEKEIEIYTGLEVDYIPGRIGPHDFPQLDYSIGSIHFVDHFDDGRGWEIDGPHSFFLEGLEKIFSGDIRAVIHRYFELTREMVEQIPAVVGHLDKIKIQNTGNKFFNEGEGWYRDEIEKTLTSIVRSGSIVEVNTRGIYQKKTAVPYPSPWVLELIYKKKIPITLSSDAHHPDDLINCFTETAHVLRQIGFRELHVLTKGQWRPFKFDHDGIKDN